MRERCVVCKLFMTSSSRRLRQGGCACPGTGDHDVPDLQLLQLIALRINFSPRLRAVPFRVLADFESQLLRGMATPGRLASQLQSPDNGVGDAIKDVVAIGRKLINHANGRATMRANAFTASQA